MAGLWVPDGSGLGDLHDAEFGVSGVAVALGLDALRPEVERVNFLVLFHWALSSFLRGRVAHAQFSSDERKELQPVPERRLHDLLRQLDRGLISQIEEAFF